MGPEECAYGIDLIRESANRALKENADGIVQGLVDRGRKGNVPPVKLLCELAGQDKALCKAVERNARPRRSLATELANEPEWKGEGDTGAVAEWAKKLGIEE